MINSKMIKNFIGFRTARNYWAHGGRSTLKKSIIGRNKRGLTSQERDTLSTLHGKDKKKYLQGIKMFQGK